MQNLDWPRKPESALRRGPGCRAGQQNCNPKTWLGSRMVTLNLDQLQRSLQDLPLLEFQDNLLSLGSLRG